MNCFILGQSGTGKSTSLRNFKSDEITYVNVMNKPLPFKGSFTDTVTGDSYVQIAKAINNSTKKVIVIDDAQYLMANEFMRRSSEKGFDKFTEIAHNFWTLVKASTDDINKDVIVYFLMHTDTADDGREKAKTIGKMLDEKICLEGMTSICLKTQVKDGVYKFVTQNNGRDTVKSPLGMFDSFEIDNDLKAVDTKIREYWQLGADSAEIEAAKQEHDKQVESGGVVVPETPKSERALRRRERVREKQEVKEVETAIANNEFTDISADPTTATPTVGGEQTPEQKPVNKRRERKQRAAEQLEKDAAELIANTTEPNPEADAEGVIVEDTVPF